MNTDELHPLASAYLQELEARARQLPPDQARELVEDIREHLVSALRPESGEADVRTTLDRLGPPAEVVAAAGPPVYVAPPAPRASRTVETSAIICLVVAELLFILWPLGAVAWVAGIVLLAVSKTWTGREKALGLAGLATGFPLVFVVLVASFTTSSSDGSCSDPVRVTEGSQVTESSTCYVGSPGGHSYAWLALALGIAYLAFQGYTIWRLTRLRRPS
ncbi:HAAS signaling domain-containing protein [Nocardioides conyzicola]|uniref:DUF1700 domain-containing protein n=1 Tax=Nocardioides conyzicola TaxID=1651781 RepID=A0ABP8XFL4_9ACTN